MRPRPIFILLISCLVHVVLPLFAEAQDVDAPRFSNISAKDGLSHHEALFVFQDTQGFMWFGTKHGLNKYDGSHITSFFNETENPSSIGGNFVHWIQEDQEGNLWIATWGDGISRYDPRTGHFTNYFHEENNPQSLGSDFVWSLFIDSEGFVWTTTDNGLGKLDPTTGLCVNYYHDPLNPNSLSHKTVSRISEDDQGVFWISTYGGGLVKFDSNTETFTRYQHNPDNTNSLSNDNLWGVFIDSRNRIWIASEQGLNSFDPETEKFSAYQHDETDPTSLRSNTVTFIYEDKAGLLWLGTFGGGLSRFDPERKTFNHYQHSHHDPYSLSNNIVMSIVEDTAGTLWMATYSGIDKWDPGENQFQHVRDDPGNSSDLNGTKVQSLYQDSGGTLWVGTNGGLNVTNDALNGFVHHEHNDDDSTSISNGEIWAIGQDKRGDLWIGTNGAGLNRFNPAQNVFFHYQHDPSDPNTVDDNAIYDLVVDNDRDVLWIAAYQSGLDKFDISEQTFSHYRYDANDPSGIVSNWVTTVFVDTQGNVWIGTENGLSRFDPETEVFTNFKHNRDDSSSLSDNMINTIFQDSRGIVWVGASNGLNRYHDSTQGFELFNRDDGLSGNRVAAIIEDNDGLLWISTEKGLSRFNLQTGTFRNYDHRDGLQGDIFLMHSVFKNEEGDLFFGGENGFNVFQPTELTDNLHIPTVVLTDFLLFNQSVQVGPESPLNQQVNYCQSINLKHDQSTFSIEFVALNYTNSRKNQYSYQLEGFDQEFIQADWGNRIATYMNLDPGLYKFQVKASNNDGKWNDDGASLDIFIGSPWWETWWFTASLVGLVFLIILAIVIYTRKLSSEVFQRRKNEAELWRSKEKFRSLFEQAGDYILILEATDDEDLIIVDANQAACKVHGYEHKELIGKPIMDLDRSLNEEQIQPLLKRILSGEVMLFETSHMKKDGTVFPVEVSSKYLEIGGDQKFIISIERDISERKLAEKEQEKLQAQLAQSQKMESIGRLAGGVAHDFNNMLSVIQGNTELALDGLPEGSPLLKHFDEITKATSRSANLTSQLLAYARKQTVVPKLLYLNETITSMLKMLERLIGEDIDLAWKPCEDLDPVYIDPGQVDQLLVNLMVNARDAIGHNTGKVSIETGSKTFNEDYCAVHTGFQQGHYLVLNVSDDGCGMDKETQAKIFEPFFTTKSIGKGTGLGLATIYGIVKQNNGFINVYSEKDVGTTFRVYLPALKDLPDPVSLEDDVHQPVSQGSETVLVVEDEPAILEMTQMMLKRLGYTVLSAATPGQAIQQAQEYNGEIQLLITDVVMPEMNGRDLGTNLLSYYPDMLQLFMSGYTADIIAHQGVLDDSVNFIQKPFTVQGLAEKVREVLRDKRVS